jgi:phosphoserine aminotransferase
MPSRSDITYFGAGPALLPTAVLEDAAKALVNYHDTGLGIAEHSHRSQLASDIINQTKADLASCLDIPDSYEILFMQGGGTGQFGRCNSSPLVVMRQCFHRSSFVRRM